jgi:hypothetical protein
MFYQSYEVEEFYQDTADDLDVEKFFDDEKVLCEVCERFYYPDEMHSQYVCERCEKALKPFDVEVEEPTLREVFGPEVEEDFGIFIEFN